ncbi:MAG: chloride channel protein, partial [Candidatus Geothermarchaeales archaeon]
MRLKFPEYLTYLERWVIYGVVIGIVSGLGATIFLYLLRLSSDFFLGYLINYSPPLPASEGATMAPSNENVRWWILVLIPTIGGLISGFIVYQWAPEAEGHGTDAVISSFHRSAGFIRRRIPLIKTVASILTIGSGGSAGREGPIAQIGAGFGSWLSSLLKTSDRDRRLMVICGAAGGIGSIFKAPFGGALFGIEVLYKRDFEVDALIPTFISSVVAYSVFCSFFGFEPIFQTPTFTFLHPEELIFYAILGLTCGLIAIPYVYTFYRTRDRVFRKIKIPNHVKPAIGGFALGLLAFAVPQVLATGYGWVQLAIYGELALSLMIIIAVAKIFATSFTISSGGSGGVFAPSMVIGSMIGGVLGNIFKSIFPSLISEPSAFVLVGMAAFFAGAAKVPIAAMIMVSEMTGDYNLLVPLMLACSISYVLTGKWTIYEGQVLTRVDSPAHREEFSIDVLEQVEVGEVMTKNVVTLSPSDSARELSRLASSTGHLGFPVVEEGRLVGIATYRDALRVAPDRAEEVRVGEIMSTKLLATTPHESLDVVLRKMNQSGYGHLPVVDPQDPKKLVGIVSKRDLIAGHEKARHLILTRGKGGILDRVKVEEVMRRDIVMVESDYTLAEFAGIAGKYLYRGYPVVENGELIGTVTIEKLIRAMVGGNLDVHVGDVADRRVVVTYPDETMHQALDKMYEKKVGRLP